ncbi:MAG: dual specificity protein phosphatase family protein [Planctomycetota bacterium]
MNPHEPSTAEPEAATTHCRRPSFWRSRGGRVLIGLLIAAGVGVWFYEEVYEERWIAPRFGVVEPDRIYRSGQIPAPIIEGVLRKHGIEVVVDLTVDEGSAVQRAEQDAIRTLGITGLRFPMGGNGVGTPENYIGAVAAIHRARQDGQRVLVHCQAGTQRTGGVVSAYRLLVEGKPAGEVYREAQRYDWEPEEDVHWPRFLNAHMRQIAEGLVAEGVLCVVPEPLPVFTAE